ncbi:MAG TPA: hypothetical protein VH165_19020, partial [Kofleriaceae bacterium]|nr:hypothetical protein [Kofleriaceae bacterium]
MKAVGVLATLVAMGGIASSQPAPQPAAPAAAPTTAPAPATPLAPGATPVAAPVPPAPSGGPGLKLDDAIKLALTRNERAKIAALDIEVAAAGVDKARVAFLPVLQATG